MVNGIEVFLNIHLHDPLMAPWHREPESFQGLGGTSSGSEPIGTFSEISFKDWFQDNTASCLDHSIPNGGNSERSLRTIRLRNTLTPDRSWVIGLIPKRGLDLKEKTLHASPLNVLEGLPIHTGSAPVLTDAFITLFKDRCLIHPVIEGMKASLRILLGRFV